MKNNKVIDNNFFDLLAFSLSFVFSFYRAIKSFIFWWKNSVIAKNKFFNFLDFLFRKWTRYFWKKPTLYKLSSFFWDILNSVFKK